MKNDIQAEKTQKNRGDTRHGGRGQGSLPLCSFTPYSYAKANNIIEDIPAMPGQKRYSPDTFPKFLEETANAGIKSILLFGLPEHKDECGSGAWDENRRDPAGAARRQEKFPRDDVHVRRLPLRVHLARPLRAAQGRDGGQRPDGRAAREDGALAGPGRSRRRGPVGHDGRARRRDTRGARQRRGWTRR